ncbi:thioredoxin domain-containing protein 12-like [Acanthaster planci]|uniref:Thioredoxin domain-containing protein 12 n=1 Tax=Acanthaster planci TaxID=133434 RepID=A0A8B7Y7J3_ACAPL|nr:thioredoxin domain-containing protein 12-like [Acanthaster planci]
MTRKSRKTTKPAMQAPSVGHARVGNMAAIMWTWITAFLSLVTLVPSVVYAGTESAVGNGFGDEIEWWSLPDGLAQSTSSGKPLMLIIHKSWCGACKALKPKFADSEAIRDLSKKFVMVNVMDDDEPNDSKYIPDGGYIPRILFLNQAGEVQTDLINQRGNPKYKYYYSDANGVLNSMQEALKKLGKGTDEL